MDVNTIEQRRHEVLHRLATEAHPLAIFYDIDVITTAAFTVSDNVIQHIRTTLSKPKYRKHESGGVATIKLAGTTPDQSHHVYEVTSIHFETIGTTDYVTVERERLQAGEVEIHTHVPITPDYLGHTDAGDLIAAIEGPAWVHPTTKLMQPAQRIYGILSIYRDRMVRFDFYHHDLRSSLTAANNYGLKRMGMPVVIQKAY